MRLTDETFFPLARAAVAFANLERIGSAAQVEALFAPWLRSTIANAPDPVGTYTAERDLLRRALGLLTTEDRPAVEPILRKLVMEKGKLAEHYLLGVPLVVGRQGFEIQIPPGAVPGVKTTWLLAVGELLTRKKQHIAECNLVSCKNLLFREMRGGCPQTYCKLGFDRKTKRWAIDHEDVANKRPGNTGRKKVRTKS